MKFCVLAPESMLVLFLSAREVPNRRSNPPTSVELLCRMTATAAVSVSRFPTARATATDPLAATAMARITPRVMTAATMPVVATVIVTARLAFGVAEIAEAMRFPMEKPTLVVAVPVAVAAFPMPRVTVTAPLAVAWNASSRSWDTVTPGVPVAPAVSALVTPMTLDAVAPAVAVSALVNAETVDTLGAAVTADPRRTVVARWTVALPEAAAVIARRRVFTDVRTALTTAAAVMATPGCRTADTAVPAVVVSLEATALVVDAAPVAVATM